VVPFTLTSSPSFVEFMALPWKPFDTAMWLGLLAAILYAGYALHSLASGHIDEEYSQGDTGKAAGAGALSAFARKQLKWERNWLHAFCPTTRDDGVGLLLSMAHALQAFMGGGDFRHTPNTVPSWIVTIGLSFLILVTISNYTAQVTTFNVLSSLSRRRLSLRSSRSSSSNGRCVAGSTYKFPSPTPGRPSVRCTSGLGLLPTS